MTVNGGRAALFLTYLKWDNCEQRAIIVRNKLM